LPEEGPFYCRLQKGFSLFSLLALLILSKINVMKFDTSVKFLFIFFIQFSSIIHTWAQFSDFNYLSTKEGLSNNNVTEVLQDSRGFIWIATTDGLNRYDGYKCDVFRYDKENINSLPNNYILCLAEDKSNNIWIGTHQSGIARYNIPEERFFRYGFVQDDESSIPGSVVRDIFVDNYNSVWIGTDLGLAKYNSKTKTFKCIAFPVNGKSLSKSADIRRIYQQCENEITIQCTLGLYKINLTNDIVTQIAFPLSAIEQKIKDKDAALLFDKNENLWIGSIDGLVRYNIKTDNLKKYIHNENNKNGISSSNI
jgi:ligand-binding sensor domain-containing protein